MTNRVSVKSLPIDYGFAWFRSIGLLQHSLVSHRVNDERQYEFIGEVPIAVYRCPYFHIDRNLAELRCYRRDLHCSDRLPRLNAFRHSRLYFALSIKNFAAFLLEQPSLRCRWKQ